MAGKALSRVAAADQCHRRITAVAVHNLRRSATTPAALPPTVAGKDFFTNKANDESYGKPKVWRKPPGPATVLRPCFVPDHPLSGTVGCGRVSDSCVFS